MIGSRLGIYEVSAKLGAGAMGEVYRARDTRLGRDVAIKVLPAAFTMDPERLARFEREAKLLASLNHPNIATIHGLEESNGALALVMELVGGESLAARIARGPIPLPEALDLARQIASALDAAHENGVIHRDLKPANILVTEAGIAKVLDFGLAKAVGGEASSGSISGASPTITSAGTAAGIILGTAAYMSPEQARGKAVDRRTDVWSFACVLYEMLTGKPAFGGETITDVLAAIVHEEPDWSALPPAARPRLERLLRRCLVKDPRERTSDLGDVALVLKEIASEKPEAKAHAPVVEKRSSMLPWVVAAGIGALALAAGFGLGRGRGAASASAGIPSISFQQLTLSAGGEGQPSISPDGESFAYVAGRSEATDIFFQRIGGRKAVNLTADCAKADGEPAFSPDGRQIAYRSECSGGGIFVMGATGESPRKVSDVGYAPAWSPDGREIAYVTEGVVMPWARSTTSTLWAVDVQTGKKRKISDHDAAQPAWSPDGKRIAFWGLPAKTAVRDLYTVAADGSQPAEADAVPVTNDPDLDWSPAWDPTGRALFFSSTRGGTFNLWRVPVDPSTGRVTGSPVAVTVPSSWAGWISLSRDGKRLIYTDRNARTTVWRAALDPGAGKLSGAPVAIPLGTVEVTDDVNISPDGKQIVFSNAGVPAHLFVAHADGSGLVQLTDGPYRDRQASFSPDGRSLVFQTTRPAGSLAVVQTDGSGLREIPSAGPNAWFPHWTPDGKRLIAGSFDGMFALDPEHGPIVPFGALSDGRNFWPTSISSDGGTVLGTVFDAAGTPLGIGTVAYPAGGFRMVVPMAAYTGVVFLPDGKRFLYGDRNRLMVADIAGGTPREVAAGPSDKIILAVAVSLDGRGVAWLETSDESDIWMATLGSQ